MRLFSSGGKWALRFTSVGSPQSHDARIVFVDDGHSFQSNQNFFRSLAWFYLTINRSGSLMHSLATTLLSEVGSNRHVGVRHFSSRPPNCCGTGIRVHGTTINRRRPGTVSRSHIKTFGIPPLRHRSGIGITRQCIVTRQRGPRMPPRYRLGAIRRTESNPRRFAARSVASPRPASIAHGTGTGVFSQVATWPRVHHFRSAVAPR